jgi:hypothetical protein
LPGILNLSRVSEGDFFILWITFHLVLMQISLRRSSRPERLIRGQPGRRIGVWPISSNNIGPHFLFQSDNHESSSRQSSGMRTPPPVVQYDAVRRIRRLTQRRQAAGTQGIRKQNTGFCLFLFLIVFLFLASLRLGAFALKIFVEFIRPDGGSWFC